jgi:pyruvate kinase
MLSLVTNKFMDFKNTKIVCTIGPSSSTEEVFTQLAESGLNVARLNFSHGNHEERIEQIAMIRKVAKKLGKTITIFADLSGPKMRLGKFEGVKEIKTGEKVDLSIEPKENELPMQFDLSPFIEVDQRIYLNDGLVELRVTSTDGKTVKTVAENDGWVSSNKGVNVPDTNLRGTAFTEKDEADAVFALGQGVDYLALSFVQTTDDMKRAKELIAEHNPKVKIIVKIEKNEAVDNLDSIVKETDAIMVARGDMGIEMNPADVPIVQQRLIKLCRQYQKPVIVATQMLESMIENPRPTRAEVSDVANAVLDQADCVMLSAESANGKYPVEAVKVMDSIIRNVEQYPDYKHFTKIDWSAIEVENIEFNAIASAAASLANRVGAKGIVVGTATGKTAKMVSAFRPNVKIVAVTHDETTSNQMGLVWGAHPLIVKPTDDFNKFQEEIMEQLRENKVFDKGDKLIIVIGRTAGMSGTTDTIKIATI